ncbi:alpha/beta hydrolase [Lentzea sp. HUAS TT2]|uniref:alpha/beta hydrolase n=1 Tax=Lentzea sp. HUAS TT2 TaxID=3447454 RepID=UPI003F729695
MDAGQWGTVPTRIIRPKGATGPLPVVFYIHGAGWVFGDDKTHDRLFRELAVGAGAAGVFPVYDRAPEKGYPTQVEQNYAVGQWVLAHGAEHGSSPRPGSRARCRRSPPPVTCPASTCAQCGDSRASWTRPRMS